MRKIKVISTVGAKCTIETNATTLGELLPLIQDKGIDTSGMKMMVGETRNELSRQDATLPESDFKLFLMPAKTKSGSSVLANLYRELADINSRIADELSKGSEPIVGLEAEEEDPDMQELRDLQDENDW
jgi:hypothetical protein